MSDVALYMNKTVYSRKDVRSIILILQSHFPLFRIMFKFFENRNVSADEYTKCVRVHSIIFKNYYSLFHQHLNYIILKHT